MGSVMPPIEPLRRVVDALMQAGVQPTLGGSGLLLAHGLVGQVRDWDLLVDADLAQVERALSDAHLPWTDAADSSGRYATTARLLLNIDSIEIDLMVGFAIWPDGASRSDLPVRIPSLPAGIWQGIPLGSLEAWLVAYRLMKRPEKPDLIASFLKSSGVNAGYLERMLAEPLPDPIRAELTCLDTRIL